MHTFNALIRAVPYLKERFIERWELAKVRRAEQKRWGRGKSVDSGPALLVKFCSCWKTEIKNFVPKY